MLALTGELYGLEREAQAADEAARLAYRPAWHGLAESLLSQQRFRTVEAELEKMAKLTELKAEAAIVRMELAIVCGDLPTALREVEETAKEFPEDVELLRARCRFLFEHGGVEQAEQALLDLCRREPSDGAAYHNLGILYVKMGCLRKAVEMLERSLAVRPNVISTQQQLASVLAQLRETTRLRETTNV